MQYPFNLENSDNFLFSSKHRLLRHTVFWLLQIGLFSLIWLSSNYNLSRDLFHGVLWVPVNMLFCYPLAYWILPKFLLKEKYLQFALIAFLWAAAGFFMNYLFRAYLFIPFQEYLQYSKIARDPWAPSSYLKMSTTAGIMCMIILFKHWVRKQQEWLQAERDKTTAELELLKAQLHPHFMFNTLNNIYSFSVHNSPKTPELILKLSSLLSYMLYDCKSDTVYLEKELAVMKDYIGLEQERYGDNIDISLNFEGDIADKSISPLLILPFMENAFKHGTSEQLEKPWLSVDVIVAGNTLKCKVVNSKNESVPLSEKGIGLKNIKKRLAFLYPGKHDLKIKDEGNFFVVSLSLELTERRKEKKELYKGSVTLIEKVQS